MMVNSHTVLASWARVIRPTLDASGCDSAPLLTAAGLSTAMLDDPNGRCPAQATARLWRLSAQATGAGGNDVGVWHVPQLASRRSGGSTWQETHSSRSIRNTVRFSARWQAPHPAVACFPSSAKRNSAWRAAGNVEEVQPRTVWHAAHSPFDTEAT